MGCASSVRASSALQAGRSLRSLLAALLAAELATAAAQAGSSSVSCAQAANRLRGIDDSMPAGTGRHRASCRPCPRLPFGELRRAACAALPSMDVSVHALANLSLGAGASGRG